MKLECKLPKAVHLPLRRVLAEALRQAKCHSRGLLVTVNRASRGADYSTGNAGHDTIAVYRYHTRKGRRLKSGKRKRHYEEKRISCDGHITITLNWPPRDPLAWVESLYGTALHEAAHIQDPNQRHHYDWRLPWAERPQEQYAQQVASDRQRAMTPRRENLLLDLAVAVEEYLASRT